MQKTRSNQRTMNKRYLNYLIPEMQPHILYIYKYMWFPGNHLHDFSYHPQKKSMYNKTPIANSHEMCFFLANGVSRQPRHWKRTFLNSEFHSSSAPAHSAKLVSSSMLKPQHSCTFSGRCIAQIGPCFDGLELTSIKNNQWLLTPL